MKEKIMIFLQAQQQAEERGENEFVCPICGAKAWWGRARSNGHLCCVCNGCHTLITE